MQALTIVEDFNVFEYCTPGFVASFEVVMMKQFDFQGVEKTLGYSIIPAITFFAHAGVSTAGFENLPVKIRGILAASATVKDKLLIRLSFPDGHQHGVIDQISHHTCPHVPSRPHPEKTDR
jgi:hypothetical protein